MALSDLGASGAEARGDAVRRLLLACLLLYRVCCNSTITRSGRAAQSLRIGMAKAGIFAQLLDPLNCSR
jgi:hypothetical protein